MKDLLLFGTGTIARLACWYFENDSEYNVLAFCVDDKYFESSVFCGKPVISFSSMAETFPPASCHIFVALGYQHLNTIRRDVVKRFEDLGYCLASYISTRASVLNDKSWGKNCFIMENAVLQPFSQLGDNCIVWSGAIISHESIVGANCFLGAGSIIGGMAKIGDNTFLGMNATVRNGVTIGRDCILGAGSLALSDLPDRTLVSAQPPRTRTGIAAAAMRFINL